MNVLYEFELYTKRIKRTIMFVPDTQATYKQTQYDEYLCIKQPQGLEAIDAGYISGLILHRFPSSKDTQIYTPSPVIIIIHILQVPIVRH